MDNFKQRDYYKIFLGTNQTEGTENINLAYEAQTADIIFKKDVTTYFHMPFFTKTLNLSDSEIINEGAIAGPIPAMADRIYKSQSNYGNSTPWGTTTDIPNGTWLCSWLYSLTGETGQWLDRFYNPGKIDYTQALIGEIETVDYTKNDPVFIDVPSTLTLEPGVLYQYFHCGEKTAQNLITTFAGNLSANLRLNVENWSENISDKSIYNNKGRIEKFQNDWALDLKEPDINDRNALSFDNTNFINARIFYNESFNLKDEFTLNFWVKNENWENSSSTQLVGNYNYGGYGVFYNNLKYYPFFVVPETLYGHLFYFNQKKDVYLDKSTQPIISEISAVDLSNPRQVAINGENELLVLDDGGINHLYKLDHLGDVLAVPRLSTGENFIISGTPKQFIVDSSNNCLLQTTEQMYLFDNNLTFISASAVSYTPDTNFAITKYEYEYNTLSYIAPGTYTVLASATTISGAGKDLIFDVRVNSSSAIESVYIPAINNSFQPGDTIDVSDIVFTNKIGIPDLKITVTEVGFDGQLVFDLDGTLIFEPSCKAVVFDNNNKKWTINNDNELLYQGTPLSGYNVCSNLAVDPENNIWVLHDFNKVTKINSVDQTSIKTFEVGVSNDRYKNISFINTYNRQQNTLVWVCLIYSDLDKSLYELSLNGDLIRITDITDNVNFEQASPNLQNKKI